MKATELMIGDWVYYKYSSPKSWEPRKWQIVAFEKDFIELADPDTSCKPIPLTAEILEKNGFVASELCLQNFQSFIQYYRDGICIVLESKWGNAFTIMCDHFEGDCPRYVHQLQNLFRVYGDDKLTELADNFKI